ncbi:hypothetical protein BABINDRAFT_159176 [Babjeviella inositovora NRRL Y-12698]|uniref:SWIRM domain-containing protein n=1 Tax=Babjeviella inositovora NRRL Y-12698 TaxID=984486 RepID=A0A1E3QYA8_9ASCO|nr:uncharacterized protein BABINDRAFT_159176 [Babjeviella inositovora NRRL Y-12698]ODQ82625.1 hypothetical protein BABINDRAFT_159176 [Babjeviella inositovora NRRL Y-12698]
MSHEGSNKPSESFFGDEAFPGDEMDGPHADENLDNQFDLLGQTPVSGDGREESREADENIFASDGFGSNPQTEQEIFNQPLPFGSSAFPEAAPEASQPGSELGSRDPSLGPDFSAFGDRDDEPDFASAQFSFEQPQILQQTAPEPGTEPSIPSSVESSVVPQPETQTDSSTEPVLPAESVESDVLSEASRETTSPREKAAPEAIDSKASPQIPESTQDRVESSVPDTPSSNLFDGATPELAYPISGSPAHSDALDPELQSVFGEAESEPARAPTEAVVAESSSGTDDFDPALFGAAGEPKLSPPETESKSESVTAKPEVIETPIPQEQNADVDMADASLLSSIDDIKPFDKEADSAEKSDADDDIFGFKEENDDSIDEEEEEVVKRPKKIKDTPSLEDLSNDDIQVSDRMDVEDAESNNSPVAVPEVLRPLDEVKTEAEEDESAKEPAEEEDYVKQTHTIVIPSYASWFKFQNIHKIEQESLPEFFNKKFRSKTPEIYARYRNFMINGYRMNPNEYLTLTSCRRNLVGDAATILRVHKFLTKWGLINYQVNVQFMPQIVEPPSTEDYQITYDTPRGLFPFETFKPPMELPDLSRVKELLNVPSAEAKKRSSDDTVNGNSESSHSDDTTNGKPQIKRPKVLQTGDTKSGWSEDDLKKLIEGITQYKHDWVQVAEHVGNKSAEQCIIRFLQLPIEDAYLEKDVDSLGVLKYAPHLPFSQADNPVISTVAFLAGLVDPEVAAAASTRACIMADAKLTEKINKGKDEKVDATSGSAATKEIAATGVGIIAARSHVFATMEERELHQMTQQLVNQQLTKVDLKLKKLEAIERQLEYEKKVLAKQQEETFLSRLTLNMNVTNIAAKLGVAIEALSSTFGPDAATSKASQLIDEARQLLASPPKSLLSKSLISLGRSSEADSPSAGNPSDNSQRVNADGAVSEENLAPISVQAPQEFTFWQA